MQPSDSSILLIGLPGTGKTNFLVALDVLLDNPTDDNGLTHSVHSEDRAYIQPLREKWLRGEELHHTSVQSPPSPHELLIHHRPTDTNTTFHVPDCAGETFDAHFSTRSFSDAFGTLVKKASGILLFLHADHEGDNELLEFPIFSDSAQPSSTAPASSSSWTTDRACRQVKLVDLLQFIAHLRQPPLRIAVVVSAWDLVTTAPANMMPRNPTVFVTKRWPLLAQYLETNSGTFPSYCFGVSARGGGTSPAEVTRLTQIARPEERVIVVDGANTSHDITRPVRWILQLLELPALCHD